MKCRCRALGISVSELLRRVREEAESRNSHPCQKYIPTQFLVLAAPHVLAGRRLFYAWAAGEACYRSTALFRFFLLR